MRRVRPAVQATPEQLPHQQAAPALKLPDITAGIRLAPRRPPFDSQHGGISPFRRRIARESRVVAGQASGRRLIVEHEVAGRRGDRAVVTGDTRALKNRTDVPVELDVDGAARDRFRAEIAAGRRRQEQRLFGQVHRSKTGLARRRPRHVERLLAVRVAPAAIGAHFAGAHLVPRLSHRERHAVPVEHLKRERRVGGNARLKARIGIALRVEDRLAAGSGFSQRDLAKHAHPLVRVADKMPPLVRPVAAVAGGLERENPDRENVVVRVLAGLGALPVPIAALVVLRGVEGVEPVERHIADKARETLPLVEAAGSDDAIRSTGRQIGRQRAVIGQPWQGRGLVHAINGLVRHDGARPHFVVARIVLDQDEIGRTIEHPALRRDVQAAVVIRRGHGPLEIVRGSWRPDAQQIVSGRRRRVREFADALSRGSYRSRIVIAVSKRRDRRDAARAERNPQPAASSNAGGGDVGCAIETRLILRCLHRKPIQRTKAVVVGVVVVLDDDVLVGELRRKMERVRAFERTHHRFP